MIGLGASSRRQLLPGALFSVAHTNPHIDVRHSLSESMQNAVNLFSLNGYAVSPHDVTLIRMSKCLASPHAMICAEGLHRSENEVIFRRCLGFPATLAYLTHRFA